MSMNMMHRINRFVKICSNLISNGLTYDQRTRKSGLSSDRNSVYFFYFFKTNCLQYCNNLFTMESRSQLWNNSPIFLMLSDLRICQKLLHNKTSSFLMRNNRQRSIITTCFYCQSSHNQTILSS